MEQQAAPVIPSQIPDMQPLARSLPPASDGQPFPAAPEQSRPATRDSLRVMEPVCNATSDTDSMLSGRAPMPMHLLQPRLPRLPEVKIPEYRIPEPRPVYEDAGATTCLTSCLSSPRLLQFQSPSRYPKRLPSSCSPSYSQSVTPTVPKNILDSQPGHAVEE
ncbi:hypothetical protein ARMSODRAFT_1024437 [Armillaria solidipes]|uniref:Uncharacterized protein n=1 Tax=Armillaria solidipes TaxID=1076256 RepID=A0A2H3B1V1_9AGAR|nr:hypothetical protein ARMSODRAFT_1024437 [Armillaria solidipes]